MNVEIFTEIDTSGFSDGEKVFAGLLTFLYKKYPTEERFTLYTIDIKTILDIGVAEKLRLPRPFKTGHIEPTRAITTMGYIEDRTSTELVEIAEPSACTVQGFLLALYRTQEDWEDYQNPNTFMEQRTFFLERKTKKFMQEEKERYFQTKRNNRYGRYGSK